MCSIGNIHFDFNCASSAPGAFSNEQQQKSCPNIQLPQGSKMSPGSDENESAHTGTYVERFCLLCACRRRRRRLVTNHHQSMNESPTTLLLMAVINLFSFFVCVLFRVCLSVVCLPWLFVDFVFVCWSLACAWWNRWIQFVGVVDALFVVVLLLGVVFFFLESARMVGPSS